ncbi:MAG: hypothetical protein ACXW13_04925 [Burkholderiaceae bacterium]
MNLSAAATGAMILTGGLANTSFVGLPMIEAWIGRDGLPYGIVIDQLGSYLALSTFGLVVAARYSGQPLQWSVMWRRIVTFPPLIALVIAILLRPIPFDPALEGCADANRCGGTDRAVRSRLPAPLGRTLVKTRSVSPGSWLQASVRAAANRGAMPDTSGRQ